MSRAYRCEVCEAHPWWRIERRGDAVVTWSCVLHLHEVCDVLQRFHERTELIVSMSSVSVSGQGVEQ